MKKTKEKKVSSMKKAKSSVMGIEVKVKRAGKKC